MELYFTKGACSLACRVVINELNLACDYISVDLMNKKTEDGRDFLTINPKGAVPVLVTNEGDILTENAVIQQYLADTNKATTLLPPVHQFERYRVLEWVNYVATEIHKGLSVFFTNAISNETKEQVFLPLLKKKFNYVDQSLEDKRFLLGEHFTLPDAYMFVMLRWAQGFNFHLSDWENITRYFAELNQRPSIKKSLNEEGLSP
jgi:glutathione S-transferase